MKKLSLLLLGMLMAVSGSYAQKIGYVNTETILSSLPEYKNAVAALESKGSTYKKLIDEEFKVVENYYNSYQQTKYDISQANREHIEKEIIALERAAKAKQNKYFGEDGTMKKDTEKALKPIMDRLQTAVNEVAKENGYNLILDLSVLPGAIYNDKKAELNDKVLEKLTSAPQK